MVEVLHLITHPLNMPFHKGKKNIIYIIYFGPVFLHMKLPPVCVFLVTPNELNNYMQITITIYLG